MRTPRAGDGGDARRRRRRRRRRDATRSQGDDSAHEGMVAARAHPFTREIHATLFYFSMRVIAMILPISEKEAKGRYQSTSYPRESIIAIGIGWDDPPRNSWDIQRCTADDDAELPRMYQRYSYRRVRLSVSRMVKGDQGMAKAKLERAATVAATTTIHVRVVCARLKYRIDIRISRCSTCPVASCLPPTYRLPSWRVCQLLTPVGGADGADGEPLEWNCAPDDMRYRPHLSFGRCDESLINRRSIVIFLSYFCTKIKFTAMYTMLTRNIYI